MLILLQTWGSKCITFGSGLFFGGHQQFPLALWTVVVSLCSNILYKWTNKLFQSGVLMHPDKVGGLKTILNWCTWLPNGSSCSGFPRVQMYWNHCKTVKPTLYPKSFTHSLLPSLSRQCNVEDDVKDYMLILSAKLKSTFRHYSGHFLRTVNYVIACRTVLTCQTSVGWETSRAALL